MIPLEGSELSPYIFLHSVANPFIEVPFKYDDTLHTVENHKILIISLKYPSNVATPYIQ